MFVKNYKEVKIPKVIPLVVVLSTYLYIKSNKAELYHSSSSALSVSARNVKGKRSVLTLPHISGG